MSMTILENLFRAPTKTKIALVCLVTFLVTLGVLGVGAIAAQFVSSMYMDFTVMDTATFINTHNEVLLFSFWMVLASFLVLFIMAATNRVVVFSDWTDLFHSLSIIISPLVGCMIVGVLSPENASQDYNPFWGSKGAIVVSLITISWFLFSVVMTYRESIKCNGLPIGLVVGTFKVVSAIVVICFTIGFISKLFNADGKPTLPSVATLFVFGIFGWALTKLVNGEAVAARS